MQFICQAFEKDPQLSIREVVQLYNILRTILSNRINGRPIYTDAIANSRKLTTLKKEVIVQEVFDLDSQRFPFRIYDVEDIANRLLAIYNAIYIELRWASNFVKQQPKLYIYWNRLYDY